MKVPIKTNRLYDSLKFIALVFLPALGTLYFALAGYWNLPNAEQIVGSITAVDAFLGLILHLNTKAYNSSDAKYGGTIDIEQVENKKIYSLNLNSDPDDLDTKDQVIFRINK